MKIAAVEHARAEAGIEEAVSGKEGGIATGCDGASVNMKKITA